MVNSEKEKEKLSILKKQQEAKLFELVMNEIANDERHKGLWGKAIVISNGDEKKAESEYIKLRVESLKDKKTITKLNKEIKEEEEKLAKQILEEKKQNKILEEEKIKQQREELEKRRSEEDKRRQQKKDEEQKLAKQILEEKYINEQLQKDSDKAIKPLLIFSLFICLFIFIGFYISENNKKEAILNYEKYKGGCYINPLNCSQRNICLLKKYGYSGLGEINYDVPKDDWEKNYYHKFVKAVETMNINCSKVLEIK